MTGGTSLAGETGGDPLVTLLRRYLPGRWGLFGVGLAATLTHRLANLAAPYLLGLLLDLFVTDGVVRTPVAPVELPTREGFLLVAGLFGAVAVVKLVAAAVRTLAWRWLRSGVVHDLRTDAFAATARIGVATLESERTGDVVTALTEDVNRLRTFLNDGLQRVVRTVAVLVGLGVVMSLLHPQLTLLVVAFVPVLAVVVAAYGRVVEPRYADRRAAVARLTARLGSLVGGLPAVKARAAHDEAAARVADDSRRVRRADRRAATRTAVFDPLREGVSQAALLALVGVGGWWVAFGPPGPFDAPLSVGTFVAFYFYGQMFLAQSARVGELVDTYSDARASARRVIRVLDHPETEPAAGDRSLPSVAGRVAFEDVRFTYPGTEEPTIRGVSFTLEPGETVGVVGPTGAGKSTLVRLLLRLYEPTAGRVQLDGHDAAHLCRTDIREAVGYVSQEPTVFEGTIRENVAQGADDDRVRAALRTAGAWGFVADLPDGIDTAVGERGVTLSGGQRQRLALARVVADGPPVVVLDEATSHVDPRTEARVWTRLGDWLADRTAVVVAHRLSTVRDADRLLVVEDGRLVERGPHEELLAADGPYADLWRAHVGERPAEAE